MVGFCCVLILISQKVFSQEEEPPPHQNIITPNKTDDSFWKNFQYDFIIDSSLPKNYYQDEVVYDLQKRAGLRLNYRFGKTPWTLSGGVIRVQLFASVFNNTNNKYISSSKVRVNYLALRYAFFQGARDIYPWQVYGEVGLAQERFQWTYAPPSASMSGGRVFGTKSFNKMQYMGFVGLGFETRVSSHTAFVAEVWYYPAGSKANFKGPQGQPFSFRQNETPVLFGFVYRF